MTTGTDADYVAVAYGSLVGRRVVQVRPLTAKELRFYYWPEHSASDIAIGILLDDGTMLVPSRDAEGNGPGHILVDVNEE